MILALPRAGEQVQPVQLRLRRARPARSNRPPASKTCRSSCVRPSRPLRRYTNPQDPSPAGRINYFGNIGAVADCRLIGDAKAGVFHAFSTTKAGETPKGITIQSMSDGTSNTAMFSEVMRATGWPSTIDSNTNVQNPGPSPAAVLYDGRAAAGCAGGTVANRINYTGLQYYRGGISHNSFYTHTLPVNWNRKVSDPAAQKYNCGDGSFRRAHIAASSYHSGGVNVCVSDGSVRFVRDALDFTVWQSFGSRSGGEVNVNLD